MKKYFFFAKAQPFIREHIAYLLMVHKSTISVLKYLSLMIVQIQRLTKIFFDF